MNHVTIPEIKVTPTIPPMKPASIPPRFELVCGVEVGVEVKDKLKPNTVSEKVEYELDQNAVGNKVG